MLDEKGWLQSSYYTSGFISFSESSLDGLDTFVVGISSQISTLDEEISKAVQAQSVAGKQASKVNRDDVLDMGRCYAESEIATMLFYKSARIIGALHFSCTIAAKEFMTAQSMQICLSISQQRTSEKIIRNIRNHIFLTNKPNCDT